jgi:protein-disulfide isomerase
LNPAVLRVAARAVTLALISGCGRSAAPAVVTAAPGAPPLAAGDSPVALPELAATRVDPSRVPVPTADSPSRGPTDAPVTIQVYSDFECPYCALAAVVLRELEREFGSSVRVVWRNLPLPMHPHAALAAVTGLEVYAALGGAAFWRFHDNAFAAQRDGLDPLVLERLAQKEGVSLERYRAAVASHRHDARINADIASADAAGVNGAPAFFVNSWFTVGALPYDEMRAIVVQALREKGR